MGKFIEFTELEAMTRLVERIVNSESSLVPVEERKILVDSFATAGVGCLVGRLTSHDGYESDTIEYFKDLMVWVIDGIPFHNQVK